MELNFLLFPAPKRDWKADNLHGMLRWVPVRDNRGGKNLIPKEVQMRFKKFKGSKKGNITVKKKSIAGKITLKKNGKKHKNFSENNNLIRIKTPERDGFGSGRGERKINLKFSLPENSNMNKNNVEESLSEMSESLVMKNKLVNLQNMRTMKPKFFKKNRKELEIEEIESFSSVNLNKKMRKFKIDYMRNQRVFATGNLTNRPKKNVIDWGSGEISHLVEEESENEKLNARFNMKNLECNFKKKMKRIKIFGESKSPRPNTETRCSDSNCQSSLKSNSRKEKKKKLTRKRIDNFSLKMKTIESTSPFRYMKNHIGGDTLLNITESGQIKDEIHRHKIFKNPLSNLKKSILESVASLEVSSHERESALKKIKKLTQHIDEKEEDLNLFSNSMAISEDPSVSRLPCQPKNRFERKKINWNLKKVSITSTSVGIEKDPDAKRSIPCVFIPSQKISERISGKILIHFHGNAEDLKGILPFLTIVNHHLELNVLGVEYPGYGLYKGNPNEQKILEDSEAVMNYVIRDLGYKEQNVIISGRSMGSGPSIHLASKFKKVKMLVLVSPFLSIKGVVQHLAGKVVAMLMKERFENCKKIGEVECPVLIIHAKKDKLVPFRHCLELKRSCKGICTIIDGVLDSHKMVDIFRQYIQPVRNFINLMGSKKE